MRRFYIIISISYRMSPTAILDEITFTFFPPIVWPLQREEA